MRSIYVILLAIILSCAASGQLYTISTLAGGGLLSNIPGTSASLYGPQSVSVDKAGNIFLVDQYDLLRLDAATGALTLVAGNSTAGYSGDNGLATNAQSYPNRAIVDSAGNLYIAETVNNRVRKVSNGVITTVAGNGTGGFSGDNGPAADAQLQFPVAVALDSAGNLYIADNANNRVRKVSGGVITTVAGGGTLGGDNVPATSIQLYRPAGITVDGAGNLYIAETIANRVRKVSNGVITTVAGSGIGGFSGDNGPATDAQLLFPVAVALDSSGNLYIADGSNNRVRKVSDAVITTVAGGGIGIGDNGPATGAKLSDVAGIDLDTDSNLYIADYGNHRVRKVADGIITTVAGNGTCCAKGDSGPATGAQLNFPGGSAVDSAGNVFIADENNNLIRKVASGVITTVAGNGTAGFSGDNGLATNAQLNGPAAVAVDSAGNLYIADSGNKRIRKVSNGVIATVAGGGTGGIAGDNGPATAGQLGAPSGVALDAAGNLYISDYSANSIREVANGVITTVAGDGTGYFGYSGDNGPATSARLNGPESVAIDPGGALYIADYNNNRIRKVAQGVITTVAGNGTTGYSGDNGPATSAQLYHPAGVAVDSTGNLYIADDWNGRIRKVASGVITTVAGNGTQSFGGDNGPATSALVNYPVGVTVDSAGSLYIADSLNERIRLLSPGTEPSIASNGIVPVDSSVPVIQPGSWISIYGSNLASGTFVWDSDFPVSLGGVSVTIDNKPAYLWFVSPFQVNLQVPDDAKTGLVSVAVTTPSGTVASSVTLAPSGPSFSLLSDGRHVAGEIITSDGSGAYGAGTYDLVGPLSTFSFYTRPVKQGETLVLYGVGFGPTTPGVPAGRIFSGAAAINGPLSITIGGADANLSFAGVTEAGLYQFNLTVPNIGSGDQALQATVNGVPTPSGPVVTVQ